jgi:hypothetical protein
VVLRQLLAQAQPQGRENEGQAMNKDKALDLALEALDNLLYWDNGKSDYDQAREAIAAIKQARSAPVQEPAIKQGWDVDTLLDKPAAPVQEPPPECQTEAEKRAYAFGWWKALEANRAAQRQWVELTDEERDDISEDWATDVLLDIFEVISAIEAKLKEKNNG